jgi:hypothetical protein
MTIPIIANRGLFFIVAFTFQSPNVYELWIGAVIVRSRKRFRLVALLRA